MARRNVADGTGANRVWALEQVTSEYVSKQASNSVNAYLLTYLHIDAHTGVRQAYCRRPNLTSAAREPDSAGPARHALRPRQVKFGNWVYAD